MRGLKAGRTVLSLKGDTRDVEDELGRGGGKIKHNNCLSGGLVEILRPEWVFQRLVAL